MSSQILREAAALMRERAEAATDGVCPEWTRSAVRHIARNCDIECWHKDSDPLVKKYHDADGMPETWTRYDDAEHIASWHPAVALAVADWLDKEAAWVDLGAANSPDNEALAVARAYLGRADA